jgi:syntaxin 1B/2/3
MAELAGLFEEMSHLIGVQGPIVEATEANAESTVLDIGKGNEQIAQGIVNIKRRNKLRRWCIGVTALIILAAVLGIGVGLSLQRRPMPSREKT